MVVSGGGWNLIGTADDGVYVDTGPGPGAWFILFGGQPTQVVDHGSWQRYFANALWGVDDRGHLLRHDLGTGTDTDWASLGFRGEVSGFDMNGDPLISGSTVLPLVRLGAPPTTIWSGVGMWVGIGARGDQHGVCSRLAAV